MLDWFRRFLDPEPEESGLETQIEERNRLDELIRCHREFGFDCYVDDLRRHREELDRRIRERMKKGA